MIQSTQSVLFNEKIDKTNMLRIPVLKYHINIIYSQNSSQMATLKQRIDRIDAELGLNQYLDRHLATPNLNLNPGQQRVNKLKIMRDMRTGTNNRIGLIVQLERKIRLRHLLDGL